MVKNTFTGVTAKEESLVPLYLQHLEDTKKLIGTSKANPTGRDSKGLWFYSPCRSERKPSFHVNPRKGVWFDFGSRVGGDIFTLAGGLCNSTEFIRQAEFIAEKMRMPIAKPYSLSRLWRSRPLNM